MAYPEVSDLKTGTVQLSLDMIDMLVAATELTDKHKSLPDGDISKPYYKEMALLLNTRLNDQLHEQGLHDLFEVRNRLELLVRQIIKTRQLAFGALQKMIDEQL